MYFEHSVKSREHLRRGQMRNCLSEARTGDVPLISVVSLTMQKKKTQLFNIMLNAWQSENASRHIHGRSVYLVVDGHVHHLSSEDGSHVHCQEEHAMLSNQQETDTHVIVYINWAQDHGYRAVCVRSSDADVFFILLKFANAFTVTIFL